MCDAVTVEETFADDLLMFVMDQYLTGPRSQRNIGIFNASSPLTIAFRLTIRKFLEEHEVEIRNIFNSLLGYGKLMQNFKDFVTDATNAFVLRGYSEKEFIEYCAIIAKLAILSYANSFRESISLTGTAIVELVKHLKLVGEFTPESWNKLNREAQKQFYKYLPGQSQKSSQRCSGCKSEMQRNFHSVKRDEFLI